MKKIHMIKLAALVVALATLSVPAQAQLRGAVGGVVHGNIGGGANFGSMNAGHGALISDMHSTHSAAAAAAAGTADANGELHRHTAAADAGSMADGTGGTKGNTVSALATSGPGSVSALATGSGSGGAVSTMVRQSDRAHASGTDKPNHVMRAHHSADTHD
jgi:hypothetical protein